MTPEAAARKDARTFATRATRLRRVGMSHKDFALIAGILKSHNASAAYAEAWARDLAETNPRFDRARFLAACGL